ncbi:MAG: hypothetical protein Q7S36_00745, partial [Candidatus Liptonbacteria bacterium]|nr:hypothetical protein [Candidatus Liptonbacteria bacterium]
MRYKLHDSRYKLHDSRYTIRGLRYTIRDSRYTTRSGQLLIEMIVALGVLTLGFLGITSLLSRALALNRVSSDSYTATYLAAEGIEVVKNILDGNRMRGASWNGGYSGDYAPDAQTTDLAVTTGNVGNNLTLVCDLNNQNCEYGYDVNGEPTPFNRVVTVTLIGSVEARINSVVTWNSRGGVIFSVNLEDHFY